MPPRIPPTTAVPVSLTALLCSPSLSLEAALSCYYAFQSSGRDTDTASDHSPRANTNDHHRRAQAAACHLPRTASEVRQQRLRQRMANEEAAASLSPYPSVPAPADERVPLVGNGAISAEAVFYLYHRLAAAHGPRAAASSFLLFACQRQPQLHWLWQEMAQTDTVKRSPVTVNPSVVLAAALRSLLRAMERDTKAAGAASATSLAHTAAAPQLLTMLHHCEAHHITECFVQDVATGLADGARGDHRDALPAAAIPSFTVLLRHLLMRWENVLAVRKKSPREPEEGGAWSSSGTDGTSSTAVDKKRGCDVATGEDNEAVAAAALARSLFADATGEGEDGGHEADSSACDNGLQRTWRVLVADSLVTIGFVAQLRLCRATQAGGLMSASEEGGEDEREALEALARRVAPHSVFGDFARILVAFADTAKKLLSVTEKGLEGTACAAQSVACLRESTLWGELLLAQTLSAATSCEDVSLVVNCLQQGSVDGGACPPPWMLPLACCPRVVRALTSNRHAALTHDDALPRLLLAVFTGGGPPAWRTAFIGDADNTLRQRPRVAQKTSRRCSIPCEMRQLGARFGKQEGELVRGWAQSCAVVAEWLSTRMTDPSSGASMLGRALADLTAAACHGDGTAWALRGGLTEVFFDVLLPALPSREERISLVDAACRALSPLSSPQSLAADTATPRRHLLRALMASQVCERGEQVLDKSLPASRGERTASGDTKEETTARGQTAASLLRGVLQRWLAPQAAMFVEASALLRDVTQATADTNGDVRVELSDTFVSLVNSAGFALEASTATAAADAQDEADGTFAPHGPTQDARNWIGLLTQLPDGVADEVHLTVWLYWMMRAITRAESVGRKNDPAAASVEVARKPLSASRRDVDELCENDAEAFLPSTILTLSTSSANSVCSCADAVAVASNIGVQLHRLPVDAVAPPMLLNWLVARVPTLSWAEAAGILLRKYPDVAGARRRTAFVYLALPVDKVQDMQHATRVLGSLQHACREEGATRESAPHAAEDGTAAVVAGPQEAAKRVGQLYTRIRCGLVWTWYVRSLQATLRFVAEDAVNRTSVTGDAAGTHLGREGELLVAWEKEVGQRAGGHPPSPPDDVSSATLARLLRETRAANRTALSGPLSWQEASLVRGEAGEGRIRIPLHLLGYFVLQERHVRHRFLTAGAAPNDSSGDARRSGAGVRLLMERLRGLAAPHLFGGTCEARGTEKRSQPRAALHESVSPPMEPSASMVGREGPLRFEGNRSASADPAPLPLPPLDRNLGALLVSIAERRQQGLASKP